MNKRGRLFYDKDKRDACFSISIAVMSAATDFSPAGSHSDPELAPYRAICRSAVLSTILAAVGLPLVAMAVYSAVSRFGDAVPLGSVGSAFGLFALVLGIAGRSTIRRYPTEYTGGRMALAGLFGGLLLLVTGASVSAYTYVTEVPKDCIRVGFWDLQPDPDHPELPISPKAFELAGKKIFIKGYMHPGVASMGKVDHFILVNDFGTCCFGGQPKPTHMIAVDVPAGKERISFSRRSIKLAGTFALYMEPTESLGLRGVVYHLQADQVQ